MKKVLIVLVMITLLMTGAVACAEELPSPTIPTTVTAEITGANGEATDGFEVYLVAETEISTELVNQIQTFVQTDSVINFFGTDVLEKTVEFLPENYEAENLMLAELYTLTDENYSAAFGEVEAKFVFATQYTEDDVLLGMVGFVDDAFAASDSEEASETEAAIEWIPVPTAVNEGNVAVTLSQEVLQRIADGESAVFVLLQGVKE